MNNRKFSSTGEFYDFLENNLPVNEYEAIADRLSFVDLAKGLISIEHHNDESSVGWIQIYDDGSISYDDDAKSIIADFTQTFDFSPSLYFHSIPF